MNYPWQEEDWVAFMAVRPTMPHAVLVHGQQGIGKLDFAISMAQALLCESPLDTGRACANCQACHWFVEGNHPDFALVRPAVLDAQLESEPPSEASNAEVSKKKKPLSKEIRIEQIRQLIEFANVGAHRSGLRVVVLAPLETLNPYAASALLKTLEEPPPSLLFLLVANRTEGILPTILSRCQRFPMCTPDASVALAWLGAAGVQDAEALLAEAGGAPLMALGLLDADERASKQLLLDRLGLGAAIDWFEAADALQKLPIPRLLDGLQRWTCDLQSVRLANTVRYFPQRRVALERCGHHLDMHRLLRYQDLLRERKRHENHPLSARALIEALLIDYRALF